MKARRTWPWLLPVLVLGLAIGLALGLRRDPHRLPSPLLGRPLPPLMLTQLLSTDPSVRTLEPPAPGRPWLLNVWASWCTVCAAEHSTLMQVAGSWPVVGLNYKDRDTAAQDWLRRRGNPYQTVWVDPDGRAGFDLGVSGVPETFLIDAEGRVRWHHRGALDPARLREALAAVDSAAAPQQIAGLAPTASPAPTEPRP